MKPRSYFYEIDIIRFCAALLVVIFHLGYLTQEADFRPIWPISWFGWVGVEIFFVVSGFVIANSASGASPAQFLKGRALRLYPAAWCCATAALMVRGADEPLGGLFPSYLRSIALIPKGPWIDDVYWTLAVEIGFYALIFGILCAGAFLFLSRVALALTAFSSLCICVLAARPFYAQPAEVVDHLNVALARHGCFFALGSWLWISTIRPLKAWECIGAAVAVVAGAGEILLRGIEYLPAQLGNGWFLAPVLFWGAAVTSIFVFSRPGNQSHLSPEAAKWFRVIGLMTYPLYLVHHIVGAKVMLAAMSIGADKWAALIIGLLFVILASWIICTFCEAPIRSLLRYVLSRHIDQHHVVIGRVEITDHQIAGRDRNRE